MLQGSQPKLFRYIHIDEETKNLLLELRDNCEASTAEENVSSGRIEYRKELFQRAKLFCEKYQIKHEYSKKEL